MNSPKLLWILLAIPLAPANAGIVVEPDVLATPRQCPHSEVHLAAHPTDPGALIFSTIAFSRDDNSKANSRAAATTYHTGDGGQTWQETRLPLQQQYGGYNARVAFLPDGTALFTSIQNKAYGQLVYNSVDKGASWSEPQTVDSRGGDYPVMMVDRRRGRVFLTVTNNRGYPPELSRQRLWISDPGAKSFSAEILAVRSDPETTGSWGLLGRSATDTVFSDGNLFLPFVDMPYGGTYWHSFVHVSPEGKVLGPARRFLASKHPPYEAPAAGKVISRSGATDQKIAYALDSRTDRLYAAIVDRSGSPARIKLTASADRGRTWSEPVAVSPATVGGEQYQISIAVNREGVVGLLWFGTRDYPENDAYDVFFAASYDEGRSFTAETKINSVSSRPRDWTQGGFDNVRHRPGGDYIGFAAAADGSFHAAWPDARDGLFQIYTARMVARPDRAPRPPQPLTAAITSVPMVPVGFKGAEISADELLSLGRPFAGAAVQSGDVARLMVHEGKLYAAAAPAGAGRNADAVALDLTQAIWRNDPVHTEWQPGKIMDRMLAARLRVPAGGLRLPVTDPRYEVDVHVQYHDALIGALAGPPQDGAPALIVLRGVDHVVPVMLPRPGLTIVDLVVAENSLWALTSDVVEEQAINRLYVSADAMQWSEVVSFRSRNPARTVAVAAHNFYFGAGEEVLRLRRGVVEIYPQPGHAKRLVVPDAVDGGGATNAEIGIPLKPESTPYRHQTFWDSSHFQQLQGVQLLTAMAYRPVRQKKEDEPYENVTRALVLRASTLRATVPPGISERFADNITGRQAELFSGDFGYAVQFTGGFEVRVPFTGGYAYDPARGGLLLEAESGGAQRQVYFAMARGEKFRVQRGSNRAVEERIYQLDLSAPVLELTLVPQPQVPAAPRVSAGSKAATVRAGEPLSLKAIGDSSLSFHWVQTAGAEQAGFGDAANALTTAIFPVEGDYTLGLFASDGQRSSFAELTVTVTP